MTTALYETDFYAWAQHQSEYLRLEEFDKIDWQNIAEEIQDLGNQTRREVESRLRLIIMHLLKWQWQPEHQSRRWRNTVNVQRRDLLRLLKKNPTLRAQLSDFVPNAYAEACEDAFAEMGLLHWTFPASCPYTTEQLVDTEFWPMGKTWVTTWVTTNSQMSQYHTNPSGRYPSTMMHHGR